MSAGVVHETNLQTDEAGAVRTPILAFISIFAPIEALWSEQPRDAKSIDTFSHTS
jgi:hypothetical protein